MRVLTTEKLSGRRELTPDGFLLCMDVPIMRTGNLIYGPGELQGIKAHPTQGVVNVTRDEAALFDPLTIASFLGKPVTIAHVPGHLVTPSMAKSVTVGTIQNPRRGTGANSDALMGDLLFTDAEAIRRLTQSHNPLYMRNPEVSPAYTAVYTQDSDKPGLADQAAIIGNSLALVMKGRGGPTCAIGDEETIPMNWLDKLKNTVHAAVRTGDAEGVTNALNEADREHAAEVAALAAKATPPALATADAAAILAGIESLGNRLTALETAETNRTSKATADAAAAEAARTATATADAAMATRYPITRQTEIASAAEILAPGVKLAQPTGDAAADMLGLQRAALAAAYTGDLRETLMPMLGGVDLATADAALIDANFGVAAAVRAKLNNAVPNTVARAPGAGSKTPAQMMQEGIDAAWASK